MGARAGENCEKYQTKEAMAQQETTNCFNLFTAGLCGSFIFGPIMHEVTRKTKQRLGQCILFWESFHLPGWVYSLTMMLSATKVHCG